ncbi:DUF427 domain-containing protein [Sphingomicrobium sediminis]|uniref:DUF427 domain-containing protein n=1 Tax=Sphingomicrobium sediminis TaxID=2950949 RepID=A0A9X2EHA4_9SPHN|nr:DUF427 domain-containing protein [Sphingomicrobium sediminis]MCM8558000.1 DUF427 domain-containing protein [Sphingomicrobium sediminis]
MLPPKDLLLARVKANRDGWNLAFRPPGLEAAGPGQESVWDYPRPPMLAPAPATIRVTDGDIEIARSDRALEVKEMAGAPVPYIPPEDVRTDLLHPNGRVSVCEWKGAAVSLDLMREDGDEIADAAWTYPDPFDDLPEGYAAIAGWIAFYPGKLDCYVGDEQARPQPGGFYGGWVTDRIKGPIKGGPGSAGW